MSVLTPILTQTKAAEATGVPVSLAPAVARIEALYAEQRADWLATTGGDGQGFPDPEAPEVRAARDRFDRRGMVGGELYVAYRELRAACAAAAVAGTVGPLEALAVLDRLDAGAQGVTA